MSFNSIAKKLDSHQSSASSQEDDICRVADNEAVQGFLLKFGDGAQRFWNRAQQIIMLGPILLTIGKNVSPDGYIGWMTS